MMYGFIDDIIKKIEDWITGKGDDEDADESLRPVLLIPGIGGSILHAVDNENTEKYERVWVRILFADHEFKRKLWSLYDPLTGKTRSLDPISHIEVPDDNYGLYSCDILDPACLIPLAIVYNFHDMIDQLKKWGYKEGSTLFGYGYDFRQSNRLQETVDGLQQRLESIHKLSGGKKVDVISHSMGGLIMKSVLALQPELFDRLVNSWTTISTPFQGAPGFVTDCLLTGVEFLKGWQKELWVAKWSTHQLLVECPSVYEMLASLTHEWEQPPQLCVWKKEAASSENDEGSAKLYTYGPTESISLLRDVLKDNTLCYNCKSVPIPFNNSILEWSTESRRLWLSAKLPEGFKFYNIYGTSCETGFHVCYGTEQKPIVELKEILHTEADFVCVDGDGTVASESSKADGLNATARYGVPGDHRGLLRSSEVFLLLKEILQIDKEEPSLRGKAAAAANVASKNPHTLKHEEHICLSVNPTSWEEISEDSEDYNVPDDVVVTMDLNNVQAEARTSATLHEAHEGFESEHLLVSTIGVCQGSDEQEMMPVLRQAMASAHHRFLELQSFCKY